MTTTLKSLLATALLTFTVTSAHADSYSDTKEVFMQAGESAAFFEQAYAYALFPKIGKGGIGIGGAHGTGRVYAQGNYIGDAKMTQVTYGLQLGAQVFSQVIFLEDQRALDEFTSGNFEFGAQATAVAITASAGAQANTGGGTQAGISGGQHDADTVSGGYRKGMAIFTIAKGGLMYEATLGGQKYSYTPK